MPERKSYDLLVLGAGPGGYVAAIRASQLGLKTAIIEAEHVGGVCLNWGCIPSKSIITQAKMYSHIHDLEKLGLKIDVSGLNYEKVYEKSRAAAEKLSKGVSFLLKKNNITLIKGYGKLVNRNQIQVDGKEIVEGKNVLIATGSRPKEIPVIPFDEESVLSSTGILKLKKLPSSLIILGGGAIGVEFAYILNTFGVKVHIVEMLDQILPFTDRDIALEVTKIFKKSNIEISTSTRALSVEKKGSISMLTIDKGGKQSVLEGDALLVAVGRTPNTKNIGLDSVGIRTEKDFIPVGDYYETTTPGLYAIGDVINTPQLAHLASREGEIAVEHILGRTHEKSVPPEEVPYAVYCEPQVGGFGLTEDEGKDREIKTALFPYRGAGKAVAQEEVNGMVKIIYHSDTQEILGAHICGAEATELLHELLLAKHSELLLEDISGMIHAHPTLSETVMEAARVGEGRAIHI